MVTDMSGEIHIVIADDHPLLRRGLLQVIESDRRFKVMAETGDGKSALARIEGLKPHIAILDVDMPGLSGLEVAYEIGRKKLPVEIVFLTIHSEEDLFHAAMDSGAKGYLLKDSASTEIVKALYAVAEGQHYITPCLAVHLVRRHRQSQALRQQRPGLSDLTPTERRILSLVASHRSSKEIAAELFIHYRTVENHRAHICQKLDLHGNNALFKFALQHKSEL
jgi:DNA-binding NarL/FixJ family response regulator